MEKDDKLQMVENNKKIYIIAGAIFALVILIYAIMSLSNNIANDKKVNAELKKEKASLVFNNQENLRYEMKNKYTLIPTNSNKFFKQTDILMNTIFEIVVFKEDGIVYLGAQFDKFEMSVAANNKVQSAEIDKSLFEPFLITLKDGAKVDDILFSNQLDKEGQNQLAGLMQAVQLAFRKETTSWVDNEENINGVYETKYTVSYDNNLVNINKKNTRFISITSKDADIEILSSKITAQLDDKSWIKNLNFEQKNLYAANNQAMVRGKATSSLKRVPNTSNKLLLKTFKTAKALRDYLNASVSTKRIAPIDLMKPEDAIKSFFTCMKTGKCNFLTIKKNLMDYLAQHPGSFQIVLDMIKDEKYAKFHHRLINMLRELGTPEAQQAMLDLIGSDEFTTSNRTQASIQVGFLAEPTFDTIERLQQLRNSGTLEEQQQMSTYLALGNLASSSQEAYDQIAPSLIKDLESSTSSEDTISALSALENTENNGIIEKVTPYFVSPDRAVRRGAVEALRLTPAPEATNALHNQLKVEEYDLVINAIAYSLQNKKDLTPEIIKDVAIKVTSKIKNSNDTLMKKSIDFLVKQSKTNKDAKDALKTMMTKGLSIEARRRIIRGL